MTVFNHPKGLFFLFFTELWERFSFYGMKSLLILYMYELLINKSTKTIWGHQQVNEFIMALFNFDTHQQVISQVYGLYFGLIWTTPIIGGFIADWLQKRTQIIFIGSFLMFLGHFSFLWEEFLYISLLLLVLGSGLFKPNLSAQIGELYSKDDKRKDLAYTASYTAICIGAFSAPVVCGFLAQNYGWHYGFSAAGVGMLLGMIIYTFANPYLPKQKKVIIEDHPSNTQNQGQTIIFLLCVFIIGSIFWAIFEQQGNSLQLFVDSYINWNFLNFRIPSIWFQSFGPLMLIIISPFILLQWERKKAKQQNSSSILKMAIGCFFMGLSMLTLLLGIMTINPLQQKLSFYWLIGFSINIAIAEIFFSPTLSSLISKCSPPRFVGTFMGLACISGIIGNILGGYMGSFYSLLKHLDFLLLLVLLSFLLSGFFYLLSRFKVIPE